MRLAAYGLLLVIGLKAHSIGQLWHQGAKELIALSTLVTISPAKAAARACRSPALCRVRITSAEGLNVCELSQAQLRRKRRFRLTLSCKFSWLPGAPFEPSVSTESYRLTTAGPKELPAIGNE